MFLTDSGVIEQNQITGKTIETDFQNNTRFLGFMYNLAKSTFLCGVVLLEDRFYGLTDSSCIPDGSDLSELIIYFQVSKGPKRKPAYFVRKEIKIPRVNVICVIVSDFIQILLRILESFEVTK